MMPLTDDEIAFLNAYWRLSDQEQRALVNAIERWLAGQPIEDAAVEFFVAVGSHQTKRELRLAGLPANG